jgi:hypothetical protein
MVTTSPTASPFSLVTTFNESFVQGEVESRGRMDIPAEYRSLNK